ncbi:MAG: hypothetical protein PF637_02060 [Spirochaetes bacterium]|jgi:hypothetical protein|nr:hypothetical protein [Spirochaetota bacterium]
MVVIYIAFVCVIVGIVFLVKSTQTEKVTMSDSGRNREPVVTASRGHVEQPVSFKTHEYSYAVSPQPFAEEHHVSQNSVPLPEVDVQSGTLEVSPEPPDTIMQGELVAVLYEDKDSSVSFSGDSDTLFPDKFQKLKRVGSGALTLSSDSMSLRFDKTMYRFDFNRLKEIRGDKSGVLLFPDNISYPLLVVAPEVDDFSQRVLAAYNGFKKVS